MPDDLESHTKHTGHHANLRVKKSLLPGQHRTLTQSVLYTPAGLAILVYQHLEYAFGVGGKTEKLPHALRYGNSFSASMVQLLEKGVRRRGIDYNKFGR